MLEHSKKIHNNATLNKALSRPKAPKPQAPQPKRVLNGGVSRDVRTIESFIGRGGAGADWAFKALDPCSEQKEGGKRIPDRTASATVAFEGRSDALISAPTEVSAGEEWDCMIVAIPVPESPFLVFKRAAGGASWGTPNVHEMPSISSGNVVTATWKVNQDGWPSLGVNGAAYRTTYKGFSVVFDASDLNNEGRVYAGQLRGGITSRMTGDPGAGDFGNHPTYIIDQIPEGPQALDSACSGMVRMKAREGIYVPCRFTDPEHVYQKTPWSHINNAGTGAAGGSNVLGDVRYQFATVLGGTGGVEAGLPVTGGDPLLTRVVSGIDNTQVGVAMFMGIHKSANLDLKMRLGMEAQSDPGSPWSLFQEDAPLPDMSALTDFVVIQESLAMAYPERFNSFGALIPVIGEAVAAMAGWGIGKATKWLTNRYTNRKRGNARYVEEDVD